MFRDNDRMTLKTFARKVRKKYKMEPSRFKLGRARKAALAVVHGDEVKQFSMLWNDGNEVLKRNPGLSFYLHLEHGLFSTCYMSLAACKIGWLNGCRPVICLDGTFLNTKYGGQLLTAVGIGGNDAIYPIAIAVVETECYSSWSWFLATLKQDLNIVNTSPFTIMSDKQKGLIKGVQEHFPDSEHRFCVRHLYQNLYQLHKGETVKQQLWACAKSTTVPAFQRNMEIMKPDNPGAHAFVDEMAPSTLSRAFFSEFPKCDILLNNTCEVFNRLILDARELPVLPMFERVKSQLMQRNYNKKKEAVQKWEGNITPKIRDKLRKNKDWANYCEVEASGGGIFGVTSYGRDYVAELNKRSCSCRRWQLIGIPCGHAIACMKGDRIKPESMVSNCYTVTTYMRAYGEQIYPSVDKEEWDHVDVTPILPPLYEKYAGRRKKNRRKHPEESADGTRLSKHGVIQHCGYCRQTGHRRGGCKLQAEAIQRENEVAAAAATDGDHAEQHGQPQAEPENEEDYYEKQYAYYEESEEEGEGHAKEAQAKPSNAREMERQAEASTSTSKHKKIDKGKGKEEQPKETVSTRG